MSAVAAAPRQDRTLLSLLAWGVVLAVSLLPDILFKELTGSQPAWLWWGKVGLLAASLAVCLAFRRLRALALFFASVLALVGVEWSVGRLFERLHFTNWFMQQPAFVQSLAATQVPRLTSSLLMVLILLALWGSFRRFFLVRGELKAPAQPIPLVLTRPPKWHLLAPAIAAAMALGLVAFSLLFGRAPGAGALTAALRLLPFVLLFACSNAFGEELLYRAPWLAGLEAPLGGAQALLLTAVYFGLAHFYGVPYGITGVLMAMIPGWLMGKAMLETRGFFWAWFIHVCMDAVIFFFMALGAVTPGG